MQIIKRLLKVLLRTIPFTNISKAYRAKYPGSQQYWERRYEEGGTSGAGSYGRLAEFKADVLETFVKENDVETVIEFGCGDGNQLSLIDYPQYTGLDVSPTAIRQCKSVFESDDSKSFFLYDSTAFVDNHEIFEHDLSISLDVIYHLTEEKEFEEYMYHLFGSADRYVIIYSSNTSERNIAAEHVMHREFTEWVEKNTSEWKHINTIENDYPYDPENPDTTSWSDFYVFENRNGDKG
jgi:hypothetical protein